MAIFKREEVWLTDGGPIKRLLLSMSYTNPSWRTLEDFYAQKSREEQGTVFNVMPNAKTENQAVLWNIDTSLSSFTDCFIMESEDLPYHVNMILWYS